MRVVAIAILLIIASADVRCDSLVLDFPDHKITYVGSPLQIYDGGIYIEVARDSVETADVILRSSFDTSYWNIQIQYPFPGGLAEGRGWCVLTHGAPDAYLLCDNL